MPGFYAVAGLFARRPKKYLMLDALIKIRKNVISVETMKKMKNMKLKLQYFLSLHDLQALHGEKMNLSRGSLRS